MFDREAIVEGNSVSWSVDSLVLLPSGTAKETHSAFVRKDDTGRPQPFGPERYVHHRALRRRQERDLGLQTGLFRCFREFNRLRLEAVAASAARAFCYALRIPGRVELPQTGTYFEARHEPSPPKLSCVESLGAISQPGRNWKQDSTFATGNLPMYTSRRAQVLPRRVAEMFAEKKIPRRCRTSWPVVVLAGKVVCVRDFPGCPIESSSNPRTDACGCRGEESG